MKGPKTKRPDAPGIQEAVGKAARRLSGPKDLPYVERLLTNLVSENALPIELLDQIPVPAEEAGRGHCLEVQSVPGGQGLQER